MTTTLTPPVDPRGQLDGQPFPTVRLGGLAATFAILLVIGGVSVAALTRNPVQAAVMYALAALVAVMAVAMWRYITVEREDRVRVSARRNQLHLIAPIGVKPLMAGALIFAIGPAAVWISFWVVLGGTVDQLVRNIGLLGLGLVGLVGLIIELASLRHPSGLSISQSGVRGSSIDVGWNDLAQVTVAPAKRGARLWFHEHDGSTGDLDARLLHSDPRLVAMIIEHYRLNPGDRDELGDERALARIRDGRF